MHVFTHTICRYIIYSYEIGVEFLIEKSKHNFLQINKKIKNQATIDKSL